MSFVSKISSDGAGTFAKQYPYAFEGSKMLDEPTEPCWRYDGLRVVT